LLKHRPPEVECDCVFLEAGPVAAATASLGATTEVIDAGRARHVWRAPGVISALREAIRRRRPEAVFAHVTKAHLYAAPAARSERAPYLWWQHEQGGQKPLMHAISGRLRASAVICSSDWTAAQQRRFSRTPVRRIYPGVELDGLPDPHLHTAGSGEPLVLGVVGRLQRWKRVELALRAMPILLDAEPRLRLRVVGAATPGLDDSYEGALRREASRLGIEHAVDFEGQVSDGRRAIGELDLLVHTAMLEPFGLTLAEALLCGVPVVAADAAGPREIVRNGVDGLLTEVADAGTLARTILELARAPARRAQMGAVGRQRALERFTAERMASEAWALVEEVAATRIR
jgi:glycosyltransferase involved in cell wall biosynthesis